MLTPEFRDKITEVCLYGQRTKYGGDEKRKADEKRLDFFKDALESGEFTDKEDIAFLLWNITDTYALLRDGEKLYENHLRFSKHLETMPAPYLYWCVCDASQKFTLQLGGYNDFWYGLYKNACGRNRTVTEENECIAFEAHRAALGRIPALECGGENLGCARAEFEHFLRQTENSAQYDFYKMIFKTCMIKVFGERYADLDSDCKKFFGGLSAREEKPEYVFGEWCRLNGMRSERSRSAVAVTAAVNAMIDCGYDTDKVRSLYNEALENGLPHNTYIEKRINIE